MNSGLWFYNIIAEYIRHAIAMQATFVNGTLEIYKPEAKLRTGFVTTNEEDLVSRLSVRREFLKYPS